MPGLLEGKTQAFVRIHSRAMLKLVMHAVPIVPAACPETLLFDVSRLSSLQLELGYIVTSATMLVKSAHILSMCKGANLHQLLASISGILTPEAQRHEEIDKVVVFCCFATPLGKLT